MKPWSVANQSSIEGAGMGILSNKRFEYNEIVTFYFSHTKSKICSKIMYTVQQGGWYCTVSLSGTGQVTYYMGEFLSKLHHGTVQRVTRRS